MAPEQCSHHILIDWFVASNWSRDTKLNKTVHYGHTDYHLQQLRSGLARPGLRIVLMGIQLYTVDHRSWH